MSLIFQRVSMRTAVLVMTGVIVTGALSSSLMSTSAVAGGFSIREQSISGLGAAFAGNAAGYDLSSIYWNSAGVASAGKGITTESHSSVIIPTSEIDPDEGLSLPLGLLPSGANDIGKVAFVPASYAAWRLNDKLTIGYGFNAPFGLSTEADDKGWAGQYLYREAELVTYNFNPVVGYQLTPTLSVGFGLQVQYTDLELKQARFDGIPGVDDSTETIQGDDWGFGFTLGMMWRPTTSTTIGIGYRSRINNTLEGDYDTPVGSTPIQADFDLPEMVTVSLRQNLTDKLRLLGTFEWTNWSILKTVKVFDRNTGAQVPSSIPDSLTQFEANWDDGYFLSGGLEFDYTDKLTLRSGIAYEWSPSQEPDQRLLSIPDANRLWLSAGATYKYSEMMTFDIAYTHIFIEDADISRKGGLFTASSESSVDIIGVSMKTKWGADGPFGILKGLSN